MKRYAFCLLALCCTLLTQAQAYSYFRDWIFNSNNPTATGDVRALHVLPDNKILIGGTFTHYHNNFAAAFVARLNSDGTLDAAFSIPVLSSGSRVDDIAVQPWDNRIVIAGSFTTVNGVSRRGIARLLPDGTLDISFNPGAGIGGSYSGDLRIWAIDIKNDADPAMRRILAGGQFRTFNGVNIAAGGNGGLVQLNLDGSRDVSFAGVISGGPVYACAYDAGGKVLAGGEFYNVNGNANIWRFIRLNADGTLDPTYAAPYRWNGFSSSVTAVRAFGGKIYAGGWFTAYNGTTSRHIARLNADGSYDTGFQTGLGFEGDLAPLCGSFLEAKAFHFLPDNKLLIGGNFTRYNGYMANRLARIHLDGSFDTTFLTGSGFDQCVRDLGSQSYNGSDSIIAGGFFTSFRDENQGTVMRLTLPHLGHVLANAAFNASARFQHDRVRIAWNDNDADIEAYRVWKSMDGSRFSLVYTVPRKTSGVYHVDDLLVNAGSYYYRVEGLFNSRTAKTSSVLPVTVPSRSIQFTAAPSGPQTVHLVAKGFSDHQQQFIVRVFRSDGMLVAERTLPGRQLVSGVFMRLPQSAKGVYFIQLAGAPGFQKVCSILFP